MKSIVWPQTGKTQNIFFHMVSLQKLRLFVFFLLLLHESYMVSLHKRIPAEAASRVPYRIFRTHFFDAAKKTSSERDYIWYPYTSRSEKPSEKNWKKTRSGSFLDHRACAVPATSLHNDSTYGKLKSERCGTTANFALLRDTLLGGTARAPYLLVPCKMIQLKVS